MAQCQCSHMPHFPKHTIKKIPNIMFWHSLVSGVHLFNLHDAQRALSAGLHTTVSISVHTQVAIAIGLFVWNSCHGSLSQRSPIICSQSLKNHHHSSSTYTEEGRRQTGRGEGSLCEHEGTLRLPRVIPLASIITGHTVSLSYVFFCQNKAEFLTIRSMLFIMTQ